MVTGGQTGVDQAAWRAAKRAGVLTGGWMPLGFLTETGPRSEFREEFGAEEHASPDPSQRTRANVRDSDASLIFVTANPGPGTALTIRECERAGRPSRVVSLDLDHQAADLEPCSVAAWIAEIGIETLNIAGARGSSDSRIEPIVESYLGRVFAALRDLPEPPGFPRRPTPRA